MNGLCSAHKELLASASEPFERAHAMPTSVYTSEQFLQSELDDIFAQEWFCAGRADSLKNAGDYITLELAGRPVMVIRDKNKKLQAQSNVCLHRMSTLLEGRGNKSSIVCPCLLYTSPSPRD